LGYVESHSSLFPEPSDGEHKEHPVQWLAQQQQQQQQQQRSPGATTSSAMASLAATTTTTTTMLTWSNYSPPKLS
jgi:uncharacterized membrane protein